MAFLVPFKVSKQHGGNYILKIAEHDGSYVANASGGAFEVYIVTAPSPTTITAATIIL